MPILECVPNISEGKDKKIISEILAAVKAGSDVKILAADIDKGANRTVITIAGLPAEVYKAAHIILRESYKRIDMRQHIGVHPRMGAVDVCPFIPVKDISIEECKQMTEAFAQKAAAEFGVPVYLYEHSASGPARRNLALIRKGEYEGLKDKLSLMLPDFGPADFTESVQKHGALITGVRDFLIAYNINLVNASEQQAKLIALAIRASGNKHKIKGLKSIGWYHTSLGISQVSCNITDYRSANIKKVFDTCVLEAGELGIKVSGSELIGLIPEEALLAAAPAEGSRESRLEAAVKYLRLNDLAPFDIRQRVLEYRLEQ
ncbi:glutamate formimidoyltransferase [Parelusimicrobium proximum]|uniref:glutamate formimidoyltransferase n=1 Tax=Parelusimicrobium proximum TaxID=3228953 RepID=UPI003D18450D